MILFQLSELIDKLPLVVQVLLGGIVVYAAFWGVNFVAHLISVLIREGREEATREYKRSIWTELGAVCIVITGLLISDSAHLRIAILVFGCGLPILARVLLWEWL